jgi:hypothetical protein
MAWKSEIVQKGMAPTGRMTKIWKLPSTLTTMRRMGPDEERWVAPPRSYELPEYRSDMKCCSSKQKYLRPLHHTNPRELNVVAFAPAQALEQVRPDNSSEQLSSFLRLASSRAIAEVRLP